MTGLNLQFTNPALTGIGLKEPFHLDSNASKRPSYGHKLRSAVFGSYANNTFNHIQLGFDGLSNFFGGGIGIHAKKEQINFIKSHRIDISYSYLIPINRKYMLSAGLQAGFSEVQMDSSFLTLTQSPIITNFEEIHSGFSGGLGIAIIGNNQLLGFSIQNLINPKPNNMEIAENYTSTIYNLLYQGSFKLQKSFEIKPYLNLSHSSKIERSLAELGATLIYKRIGLISSANCDIYTVRNVNLGLGYYSKQIQAFYIFQKYSPLSQIREYHQISINHRIFLPKRTKYTPIITPEF